MIRIIAGGTGFVGQYLVNKWLPLGTKITVIGRSLQKIQNVFGNNVNAITWEDWQNNGQEIAHGAQLILNLAGTNIAATRWNDLAKAEFLNSRTETTKAICSICATLGDKSPPLLNASAVGIYGLQPIPADGGLPPALDETTPIDLAVHQDILAQIAYAWEKKTEIAKAHGVRVVNLRFGVVLGAEGGALTKLSLPFKYGLGAILGSGAQPFPWIHIADLAAAIEFLINKPSMIGPINFVAPQGIQQREFAKALGNALNRPVWLTLPAPVLTLLLGEDMANSLMLNGQHAAPGRLLSAGFEFRYPDINSALTNIYK